MKTSSSHPDTDNPRDAAVASSAEKAKTGAPGKREHRSPLPPVEDATDGVMEDAERKGVEEERVRFQAKLLDAVGQAVIATDLEGKAICWNRAAEEIYGWSKEEVVGQTFRVRDLRGSQRAGGRDPIRT
jgi:PAS domain-containing protein